MIIARFIKPETERYQRARAWSQRFDSIFKLPWNSLFISWSFLLAGFGAARMQAHRHLYWDTTINVKTGLFFLGITMIIMGMQGLILTGANQEIKINRKFLWVWSQLGVVLMLMKPLLLLPVALTLVCLGPLGKYKLLQLADDENQTWRHAGVYLLFLGLLFITGWFYVAPIDLPALLICLPYLLSAAAVLAVYRIYLACRRSAAAGPSALPAHRISLLLLAGLLSATAAFSGYLNNDPVISTAAMVYLPFLLVAIVFPPHIRHIQRALIYPVFTLAMLVAVRHPWYLLPLALNFWILRSYTYLRFGEPQPSFKVDYD